MRFINKWSYSCAKGLSQMLNEDHQKKAIYYYGFQIAIGSIFKIVTLVVVSLILGVLIPALIISVSFALLRKMAGGYHMKTYGKCLFVTISLFVGSALVARYTNQYWSVESLLIFLTLTFITAICALIKYAPKDTLNRLITDPKEKRKFKTLSIIYMFVWLIVVLVSTMHGMNMYTLSLCFSVLLEIFGITPIGHNLFEKIEYGLTPKAC